MDSQIKQKTKKQLQKWELPRLGFIAVSLHMGSAPDDDDYGEESFEEELESPKATRSNGGIELPKVPPP